MSLTTRATHSHGEVRDSRVSGHGIRPNPSRFDMSEPFAEGCTVGIHKGAGGDGAGRPAAPCTRAVRFADGGFGVVGDGQALEAGAGVFESDR